MNYVFLCIFVVSFDGTKDEQVVEFHLVNFAMYYLLLFVQMLLVIFEEFVQKVLFVHDFYFVFGLVEFSNLSILCVQIYFFRCIIPCNNTNRNIFCKSSHQKLYVLYFYY